MQDFVDQAHKNGVVLLESGKCQFCGAGYQRGIFECMEHYNYGIEILEFGDASNHVFRFLSVDAHALQHPEIHGRWSNHFHLTRLHLMLDKKQNWDYKKSPLLSEYLNAYKLQKPNEQLIVPEPLKRGNTTSKELSMVTTAQECREFVKTWASAVYQAWGESHVLVSGIADGFLTQYSLNQLMDRK